MLVDNRRPLRTYIQYLQCIMPPLVGHPFRQLVSYSFFLTKCPKRENPEHTDIRTRVIWFKDEHTFDNGACLRAKIPGSCLKNHIFLIQIKIFMLEFFNSYTRLKNSVRNVYIRLRTRMSLSKANRCELTNLTISRMM